MYVLGFQGGSGIKVLGSQFRASQSCENNAAEIVGARILGLLLDGVAQQLVRDFKLSIKVSVDTAAIQIRQQAVLLCLQGTGRQND